MTIDFDGLARILRDAAKAEILPRFGRLSPQMVRQKSEAIDIVTEADEAAERFIQSAIQKLMPEALFIGEESVAADPKLLGKLDGADLAIIIDPIDGTANYAAGMPLFGVMAAIVAKGEMVGGIIFDPMGDDWVMAERGGGTWQKRPDGTSVRLRAAKAVPLEQMVGMASVAFLPPEARPRVLANLAKVRISSSYRCAAHEYRIAAAGHVHFLMFNKLLPWDHLAGTLILQEAGAHAARFDGTPYLPTHNAGGLLIAPDEESWQLLRAEVFTV